MCPYHSPLIRPTHKTPFFTGPQEYITWDLLDKIATQCGELRIPIKIGNVEEPLLHPKAVDFVKACRTRGAPSAHITTNGWPLTERKCRELLEAGLTSLYISVDAATPETYLKIRGGDLEKLEANVHTFLRVRKEMNADCRVMMSFVKNKGVSVEEAMQFREKWLPVTDGVIFYNLAEMVGGNSHYQEVNPIAKETLKKVNGRWPCLNPFQEMYILPDGRIYYCCETIAKLAFAELRSVGEFPEQSISDIWKGQLYQELRRDLILNKLDEQPACKDCGIWMAHASDSETKDGRKITWNMITELVEPVPKAA